MYRSSSGYSRAFLTRSHPIIFLPLLPQCSLLPYGWATPFEWALPEKANCDDAIERVSSREECTRAANSLNLKFKGDKAKMLKKSKAKKYAEIAVYINIGELDLLLRAGTSLV